MKNTKKSLYLAILLIGLVGGTINNTVNILADYTTYTIPFIDGTYEQAIPDDVYLFLGNELESIYPKAQPSIDIDTLSFNETYSQLELSFFGSPILDSYHEYRIMISWDKYIGQGCEGAWLSLDWDLPIYETTNVTLCSAGGASWFGVTNGSYNSFVNSLNDSVLLEQTNDSVILDEWCKLVWGNQWVLQLICQ